MQLLNTNVAKTTEGTLTVEFHGEGNEMISVRMASDAAGDESAAILRAKEMMVQITSFGVDDLSPSVPGEGVSIYDTLAGELDDRTEVV
ncbi:hypothetical protein [Rhizobium sp. BE258]|uniref:hypothetical protein n=1 Tax=Rhizobium sp. BE258 TaxID=2817722 RepID=UPI00285CF362|nr:hypothetical protein [Rhizobium sp. BE258]MDR7145248.1 hypothetical protein [Rhizobium sp. BE258]